VGEAYERLIQVKALRWEREVRITGKSKPLWKAEWKGLRQRARRSKAARKELKNAIRRAKREM